MTDRSHKDRALGVRTPIGAPSGLIFRQAGLRILTAENAHDHHAIGLDAVVDRARDIDLAAIAGANMIYLWPKLRRVGDLPETRDRPLKVSIR
jgi:hypothetical protein